MIIAGKRVALALTTLTLLGAWALPASAAIEPASSAPNMVKIGAPAPKVAKPRLAKAFWRDRPIRIVSAEWSLPSSYHASVSYLILGVGF
jgi:hypothetical protein